MTGPRLEAATDDVPRALLDEVVAADPDVLPSQEAPFLTGVTSGVRRVRHRLYVFDDGTRAVLSGIAYGPRFASMSRAWGYGGLVAEGPLDVGHVRAVLADLRRSGYRQIELRPAPRQSALWDLAVPERAAHRRRSVCSIVPLAPAEDPPETRYHADTRRRIRRATAQGVEVERRADDAALSHFLTLLRCSVARWAARDGEPEALAQLRRAIRDPLRRLRRLRDAMGDGFGVYLAWLDGRPVSAAVVLQGRNAHYTRGAIDAEAVGTTGATHLLQHVAITDAARAGCRWYLMGESAPGSGLERFKSRFGARAVPLTSLRIEPAWLTRGDEIARRTVRRVLQMTRTEVPAHGR